MLFLCACFCLFCFVGADILDYDKYYVCDGVKHIYINPERVVTYESFSDGVEGYTIKSWQETDIHIVITVSAVVNSDQSFVCNKNNSTVKCGIESGTKVDCKKSGIFIDIII